jgi:ribosomal protein L16 Arg81 hydroxylase
MAMDTSFSTGGREAGRPPFGLAELVAPVGVDEFEAEYWDTRYLLVQRGQPDYFASLMTLADMDHLLSTAKASSSDLRLVAEGTERPLAELVDSDSGSGQASAVEALYQRYRDGATVNLLFVQEQWEPLGLLCQTLSGELSARCHTNVYLTPSHERGLNAHYDTHDVFVAQVYGSKHWKLWDGGLRLPLRSQPSRRDQDLGELVAEFDLNPGDTLYLPRGTVHQAVSNDTASLHLTVGVQPVVWAEIVRRAVDRVVEGDLRYREALPMGFARDRGVRESVTAQAETVLSAVREALHAEELVAEGTRRAVLARKPALEGHLLDLERMASLDLDTKLAPRERLAWDLRADDSGVELSFHGKEVHFPAHVSEELLHITGSGQFTGRQIPGGLDEPGRLVLLRTLIREGFLTVT